LTGDRSDRPLLMGRGVRRFTVRDDQPFDNTAELRQMLKKVADGMVRQASTQLAGSYDPASGEAAQAWLERAAVVTLLVKSLEPPIKRLSWRPANIPSI
jgi:hypothetical protein